jgi:hypothetical protein
MKGRIRHSNLPAARAMALTLAGLGVVTGAQAVSLTTSATDEPQPRQTEISFVYGSVDVDEGSNEALLQQDYGIGGGNTGGLEGFYWENEPQGDWKVYFEGRWLADPDDIAVSLEMHNFGKVTFKLDFLQWKEYSLGAGPWFAPSASFAVLSAEALEKEINRLNVSLTYRPSDRTRFDLAYGFFNRKGSSLSTRFGDDYQYRIGGLPSRGIIPALIDGEETVHTIDARVVREEEVDRAGLRLHFQRREVDRRHVVERAARQPAANRFTSQDEDSTDDLFATSGFVRRGIGDNFVGSVGFAFTRLDGDLTGSRIFGAAPEAAYDPDFPALQYQDRGYLDLETTRKLKQWIFNANLVYTPSENTRWMTGLRLEHLETDLFSSYIDTHSTVDWGLQQFQLKESLMAAASDKSATDVSAFLEGRYTGFNRVLLYSRVEVAQQEGDLQESWSGAERLPSAGSAVSLLDRVTDFDRTTLFWQTGLNYYPRTGMRFSLQGYLKHREHDYGFGQLDLPAADYTLYPGYIANQVFTTRDVNARVHLRLLDSLKSVTRIDYQETTIDNEDQMRTSRERSERERVVFNQSLTWTPGPRLFFSGSFSYVEDLTKTGAAELEGTFGGIVVNLPNDYWQVDLNLYCVVTKLVDLQLGYQYLEMSNHVDNSALTVPFGTDLEQHHGSARLIFHISPAARARIGYDVYDRVEPSAGGFHDYTAHVLHTSFQLVF